jgi:glycosyltransferase involved in cell wall biosynthesis
MRILMIAPQPFFQPRGTPFSEFYRIRAMTELGHEVDLVTYPIGDDVDISGLTIYRTPSVPGIRSIRIGPSLAKVPLDALIFTSSLRRLLSTRYDVLDCHEEAGLMGVVLSKLFGVPTIYDMHSSLPEQLDNFRYSGSRPLRYLFDVAERITIKGSKAVIYICPYLGDVVARVDGDKPRFLIENSPLAESGQDVAAGEVARLRTELGLDDAFVLLYTGTFEVYQGLELLYEALALVQDSSVRLLMVGGNADQIEAAKRDVARIGVDTRVVFSGQRPPAEMPRFLALGDALVSPRSHGKNTPLKIYSYLRSAKPIVATRILTHTQVLDDEVAILTEPTPEAFARGIDTVVSDRERAREIGANARRRSDLEYSYERYLERTRRLLDFVSKDLERPLARETPARLE